MTPYDILCQGDGKRYRLYRPALDLPGAKSFEAVYEQQGEKEKFFAETLSSSVGATPPAFYGFDRDLGWGWVEYTEDVPEHVPYWRAGAEVRGWKP